MSKIFRLVFGLIGIAVAVQYAAWGIRYAGAILHWNEVPAISQDWMALAMFGAAGASFNFAVKDWIRALAK